MCIGGINRPFQSNGLTLSMKINTSSLVSFSAHEGSSERGERRGEQQVVVDIKERDVIVISLP